MTNFENFALINSVLGGFSFTFLSALITTNTENKFKFWIIITSIISSICFLLCALGWSFISYDIKKMDIQDHHQFLVKLMLLGLCSIFITIALSGWIQNRKTGIVTSILGIIGLLIMIFGILGRYIHL